MDTQYLRQTYRPLTPPKISANATRSELPKDSTRQAAAVSTPSNTAGPVSAQQILSQRLDQSLREVSAVPGSAAIEHYQTQDYSPSAVANRVLNFIQNKLSQVDPAQHSNVLTQATAGIEQGFAQAREILEEMGLLTKDTLEDIDSTYSQILTGVENLAAAPPTKEPPATSLSALQMQTEQYARSERTAIEIVTQEGDRVTIELGLQSSARNSSAQLSSEGLHIQQSQSISQERAQLSYTVEGELSKDERKAVDKLLRKMDKLADHFYAGNVDKALHKAAKLGFDGEQIAQFSVSLSVQESLAVSTYQETAGQGAPLPIAATEVQSLSGFMQQLQTLADEATQSSLLEDVVTDLRELMLAMVNLKDPQPRNQVEDVASIPAVLTEQFVNTVLADAVDPASEHDLERVL